MPEKISPQQFSLDFKTELDESSVGPTVEKRPAERREMDPDSVEYEIVAVDSYGPPKVMATIRAVSERQAAYRFWHDKRRNVFPDQDRVIIRRKKKAA